MHRDPWAKIVTEAKDGGLVYIMLSVTVVLIEIDRGIQSLMTTYFKDANDAEDKTDSKIRTLWLNTLLSTMRLLITIHTNNNKHDIC